MDKKFTNVLISLVVVLVIFAVVMFVLGAGTRWKAPVQLLGDQATLVLRFVFVVIGIADRLCVYYFATQENNAWEVGTRQVVWMAIGAALYAVFSWLFNGTVFVVPSLSQVSLRPAIAIPMFFGYAFGPVVGFFTGAVGNMFGDALTGFGLSPQWSIGNGLVGFIAGLACCSRTRRRAWIPCLYVSGVLAVLAAVLLLPEPQSAQHAVLRSGQQHLRRCHDLGLRGHLDPDRLPAGPDGALCLCKDNEMLPRR